MLFDNARVLSEPRPHRSRTGKVFVVFVIKEKRFTEATLISKVEGAKAKNKKSQRISPHSLIRQSSLASDDMMHAQTSRQRATTTPAIAEMPSSSRRIDLYQLFEYAIRCVYTIN